MADFCWQCAEEVLGTYGENNDMKGLCEPDEEIVVMCEGCGLVAVDSLGRCGGGESCHRHHHRAPVGCLCAWEELGLGL